MTSGLKPLVLNCTFACVLVARAAYQCGRFFSMVPFRLDQQRILTIAFLRPGLTDHWVNRLTSRVSVHPFCHVELFFETINQCFSIVWGEIAGFRPKNLANPNYQLVSLAVSTREYDACLEFCRSAASQAILFDNLAMWRSWFHPALSCTPCDPSSQQKGRTFCSKIITEALQFAGVREVDGILPASTTPSVLYHAVCSSPRVICSGVPFKRQALMRLTHVVVPIRMT